MPPETPDIGILSAAQHQVAAAERAQASAPPDVSRQLRTTAQAEADALQQSADAVARHDYAEAASATALAGLITGERQRLEAATARYEQWSAETSGSRQTGGKASAELQRRGLTPEPGDQRQADLDQQPQTMIEWWQQFEANCAAVDLAIEREHQAAVAEGKPWPPERNPQPAPNGRPEADLESHTRTEAEAGTAQHDNQTARLDELLARVDQAAHNFAAQEAQRQASSEYAARIQRDAQLAAEAGPQAEAPAEADIEL